MSALSKLFVKTISRVIKSTTKFEIAIDDLILKFQDSCPPKDQLLQIVKQKNQIQTALGTVISAFSKLQKTVDVTTAIVTAVGVAVKIIKALPIPTSFPPGVGIPINVITILSDSLDKLGDLISSAKGSLKIVPGAAKTVTQAAQRVLDKLALLDGVLNKCLEELLNNENMEWDPNKEYGDGDVVTFGNNTGAGSGFCSLGPQFTTQAECEAAGGIWSEYGNGNGGGSGDGSGSGNGSGGGISYYKSLGDGNLNNAPLPAQVPPLWTGSDITEARDNLALEIGNVAAESGVNVDINLNQADEEALLDQLDANSNDPYLYEKTGFNSADWRLIIEVNDRNDFPFPQRRIRAQNINTDDGNPYKNIVVYNIFGKKYSYSLSVEVLVNEVIFIIENLNTTWYENNNVSGSLGNTSLDPTTTNDYSFNYDTIAGDENVSDPNSNITSSAPTSSNNINFIPISFIADGLVSNTEGLIETKRIDIPTNTQNPIFNQIQGRVITTQISQSIDIILDPGTTSSGFGSGVGFGNFNNNLQPTVTARFTPDVIKTWSPSVYPNLKRFLLTTNDSVLVQRFTYNETGSYVFKLEVMSQSNININGTGNTYLRIAP